MRRHTAALAALLALTAATPADDPCVSGLKEGQRPGPYTFHVATGPQRGQLTCYVCDQGDKPAVIVFARTLVEPLGNAARTQDAYQRLVNVDPFDSSSHAALGKLALQRKDSAVAIRSFRSALATNPPDRAATLADLGESYLLAGRAAEAKTQILEALELAPAYERAQNLLLRVVDQPAK